MAASGDSPVAVLMPGEKSQAVGMNGKKQKNRLENILFKLKRPEPADGESPSPLTVSDPQSPDQGSSHGNEETSNGNDDIPAVTGTVAKAGTDSPATSTNTNRRSSRKPSKRGRGSAYMDDDSGVNDGLDESSNSQQASSISGGKGEAQSDEIRMETADRSASKSSIDFRNIRIKVEKDDTHDYPGVLNSTPLSLGASFFQAGKSSQMSEDFSCRKCNSTFQSPQELGTHVSSAHAVKNEARNFSVHPCFICGKSFSSEEYLTRHIAVHDAEGADSDPDSKVGLGMPEEDEIQDDEALQRYNKCYRCRRVFSTDDALQMHKCRKGLVRAYGCGHCGRSYTHFTNLTNHMTVHKDGLSPDLECYECGQKFMYSIELRRHINIHIKADYTPTSARGIQVKSMPSSTSTSATDNSGVGTSSMGNDSLKLKLDLSRFAPAKKPRKRGPPKVNPCPVCGKIFYQRSYLTMHMKVHSEKQYQCEYCHKKFTFKKSMEIHVRSHTGEKPYHCDICNKDFTRQDSLQKHQRMHMGVKPYVCETCGRQFGDKFELQRHSLSHSQEKPHKCKMCNKAYNDKKRLKEHMFHHLGTLPYKCEICGKGFARKYRFRQHMDQHAGDAKFFCEVCNKGFYRRSDLTSHEQTHSGKRPFKCDTCHMGFLRESYLRRHMIVHSAVKPHVCTICGKDFARKNTLRRHILIHKRKQEEDEFAEINERYNSYATDFGYGITGAVAPLSVTNDEERDIMKDIQAVIGLGDDVNMFE